MLARVRLQPRQLLFCFLSLVTLASLSRALDFGADRQTVLDELGRPTSSISKGTTEFLNYPSGVRVDLENGRVVRAHGLELGGGKDEAVAPAAPRPATPAVAPTPAAKPREAPKKEGAKAKPGSFWGNDDDDDATGLDDDASAMESAGIFAFGMGILLVLVVFYFGVTCLALKIAFKIWEQDMFIRGYLAIAGIDLTLRIGMDKLGQYTHGMTSSWYLQQPISTLVMIFTIRHFSFNKDWGSAVQAAFTAKVAGFILFLLATITIVRLAMKFAG